jgi:CRISPR-associated protein Csb2
VSATPVVLDRYPKDGDIVAEVRRACRTVGLPDPAEVRVGREPLLAGAVRMRTNDLPEKLRGRLFRHVALTFERTVAGPVLLGAGRYLGVGLLAPVSPPPDVHSGPSNAQAIADAGRAG